MKSQKKKLKKTFIDPPSGWKYGFPRVVPDDVITQEDYIKWFKKVGYPEKDIEFALKYSRHWEE